jgi:hypothetical protein
MELQLHNSTETEIKRTLVKVMALIGLNTENITNEELTFVALNIKTNFKDITNEELFKAFELSMLGRLDYKIESNKKLSPLFCANVLQSYKRYRRFNPIQRKELPNSEKKHISTYNEKKSHYEWLVKDVFIAEGHDSMVGEFPQITICNFKDVFEYLETEEKIFKLQCQALKDRLKQIESLVNSDIKNPLKKVSYQNLIQTEKGDLPATYYRYEVIKWFNDNRNELVELWG